MSLTLTFCLSFSYIHGDGESDSYHDMDKTDGRCLPLQVFP